MKYVKLTVIENKNLSCDIKDERCPYTKSCAIHNSADAYRSKHGFTPEVNIKNSWAPGMAVPIKSFRCITSKILTDKNSKEDNILPITYYKLKRGPLIISDLIEDKNDSFAKTIEELNTENTKLLAGPNAPKHKATNEVWQTQLQVAILSQLIAITRILMKDES